MAQRTKTLGPATQVVYCPAVGYSLHNDTGWRCWLEADAEHFVLNLRRQGHYAWAETLNCIPA